jgi:transcriptional regulator with XRE-family HTH domain
MSEKDWKELFPRCIKIILKLKNIRQRELAKRMGISEVSLSRYLNGERIPKANYIITMAKALGISVSLLLDFQYLDELEKMSTNNELIESKLFKRYKYVTEIQKSTE